MRVFIASMGTETNTFASFPTALADFRSAQWIEDGVDGKVEWPWTAPQQLWLRRCRALGWETIEGLHCYAEPGGVVVREAYEAIRDTILRDFRAAGEIDLVLLYLHGAMVADGTDDCEGDLVARIRAELRLGARIGVLLDHHAHLTETLIDVSDAIVLWKTYPHVDYRERADDLFTIMQRTLAGEIEPVMAQFDCRTLGLFPTTRKGPMPTFVAAMLAAEGKDGILSLSLVHGFGWADLPITGACMLAIADRDPAVAERAASAWGTRFYRERKEAALPFTSLQNGVARVVGHKGEKPILLADTSDQVGGGAPGDTTHLLRALIEQGVTRVAFAPLFDPLAIGICFGVGVGARLKLRIGGKFEPQSGPPLDLDATVLHLKHDAIQGWVDGETVAVGDLAVVGASGLEIVLVSKRVGLFSPTLFTWHGVTLEDKQVICVKGLYKHTDLFDGMVHEQLYLATPGTCSPDWAGQPFTRLRRPMWPIDADPLGLD